MGAKKFAKDLKSIAELETKANYLQCIFWVGQESALRSVGKSAYKALLLLRQHLSHMVPKQLEEVSFSIRSTIILGAVLPPFTPQQPAAARRLQRESVPWKRRAPCLVFAQRQLKG